MSALWPVIAIIAGVFPLGWLAARAERDERFARRVGGLVFVFLLLGLCVSIARGDLLRFGADEAEMDSGLEAGIR